MEPSIQFAKRKDGVKIAYSIFGKGPPLVIPPPWTTSLRFIVEDPYMNFFMEQLAQNVTVIFYDKHGCGQSDRERKVFTLESELFDLETIVNYLNLGNFNLLGSSMSGPLSIYFTASHPNKVSKLVLYGTYANGKNLAKKKIQNAIISLIEASWGLGSKTLADVFTPNATAEEIASHARYQRLSSSSKIAIEILKLCYSVDVTKYLSNIKSPTIILHKEGDKAVPISHGRELSSEIANSKFKILSGSSHPIWFSKTNTIVTEMLEFLDLGKPIKTANMPAEQKVIRKLSALLSADVKGYSLLMADDEVHTIQTLKAYRTLMSNLIDLHSGRVVDNPGDNLLAEFRSAVDAVQCAVDIQKRLKKENDRFVEGKRLEFRIGVNIGDVVQDEDRIYGSSVNVAARIEGVADPGGICISRNAYDHVKDKLDLGFGYLGEHEVKNIKEPVCIYKVLLDSDPTVSFSDEPLEITDTPSIAVLPFDNMSGDISQEYFSDGLTDQIINGLCKVANLFVIARNSSFAYKGKSISIKQIANELGVQYILEGSVQKAGDRVRITAQLIDASTDLHKWSESYDRELTDIFDLQDEITMNILWAMNANVTHGEQAQIWSEGMKVGIKAYDAFMRGLEQFYHFNREDNDQAKTNYQRSLDIEPSPIVYAMLGFAHLVDLMYGWSDSPIESFDKANKCAESAYEMNEDVDILHMMLGWINLYKGMHDKAILEGKRAVQLNPNGAEAHVQLAAILVFAGNPDEAIRLINRAFRLNPTPTSYYYNMLGIAYRSVHQYEDAITACEKMVHMNPNSLPPYITLASCHSLLNQMDKARQYVTEILRIDPQYSIGQFALTMPFKDKEELELYLEALRKAGLTEQTL